MKVPLNGIFYRVLCVTMLVILSTRGYASLSIDHAQNLAVSSDSGITQMLLQSQATQAEALSQSQLPDPVLIVGAQNLPTDTFKFDQEPMTQFKVGIRQTFSQGDTLSLQEKKLSSHASSLSNVAKTRYLTVTQKVRRLWLEVQYWEREKKTLDKD